MTSRSKIIITSLLLVFLGGLSAADYYLSAGHGTVTRSGSGSTISSVPVGGVRKQSGPDVETIIAAEGFTTSSTSDLSFLAQIGGSDTEIEAQAILKDGDRAGSVTWIESPKVKTYFISLKEALLTAFSADMRDLKDETLQSPTGPVRNYLTFVDPSLSTERLVFVRVRERLYEFHIVLGKEEMMNTLIQAITTK
ncbi:hypothetical protein K8942_04265 [Candidatus Peribacteria bacterium]|nr:MAG: hypothetical protein K8942_04265 [Candidatus Peribacteria bacterium]